MHLFTESLESDWARVWQAWKKREEDLWIPLIEERGYRDWEEFRQVDTLGRYSLNELGLEEAKWTRCQLKDMALLPSRILCGPFKGWSVHYKGKRRCVPFETLAKSDLLRASERVQNYLNQGLGGKELEVIVLYHPERDVYMLLDGHHSMSQIAIALADQIELPDAVWLNIGEIGEEYWDLFGRILDGEVSVVDRSGFEPESQR